MNKKKFWKRFFRITAVLLLLSFLLAWFLLPKMILVRERKPSDERRTALWAKAQWEYGLSYEEFDVTTSDGLNLDGYLVHAKTDTVRGVVITLHGIGAYKERFLKFSNRMAESGYETVLFDLRGHGESEGDYCTYGFYEKVDVSLIVDKLVAGGDSLPIGVMGQSLGGAIAYHALASDERLDFGIVESTFDNLHNVVHIYGERWTGFPCDPICDFALWRAESVADFEADSVCPLQSASKISVPMFVAHGTDDKNIPLELGKRNFDVLLSTEKIFYEVQGAGHNNLATLGGEEYDEAMMKFLEETVRASE